MKHIKPTKEELEAENAKLLRELENNPSPSPSNPPPSPSPSVPIVSPSPSQPIASPSPSPEVPSPSEPAPSPDYKEKFKQSSREAQVLAAKNKKTNEAIDKAAMLPDPTDEELQKEYPDWDVMSDVEKKLAKDSLISTRRFATIHEATREFKNIDAWNGKVDKYVENPQTLIDNPDLEGKTEEFKVFATKPTRRGVDFEDLIAAFLYDVNKQKPIPKRGKMFEEGSGGPNEKPKLKGDKITVAESEILRQTNYAKYKEYLKAGKILNEV